MWTKIKPWIVPTIDSLEPQPREPLKLQPGLTHYRRERDGEWVRYHLRVENSGQALLLVAAVEAVRLTRSGAIAAFGVLEGKSDAEITEDLARSEHAASIIADVRKMVAELGKPSKRYPVFNLADSLGESTPCGLIAPFQADVVLGNWETTKACIQSLWNAGIPHVRFVGADPRELDPSVFNHSELDHSEFNASRIKTLRSAVEYAEDIGMIAGLRMRASSLLHTPQGSDKSVLDRVAELGLDYVVVPWGVQPDLHRRFFGEGDWDCVQKVVERADHWELTAVLEAALIPQNVDVFDDELDKAIQLGVEHIEVFAVAEEAGGGRREAGSETDDKATERSGPTPFEAQNLRQLASWIEDLADNRRVQIIWLPPVSSRRRLDGERVAQLILSGPRAGGDVSIRVQHDGQVIPPRGPVEKVGRIQINAWSNLWNHPCFYRFREMVDRNEHCSECSMMTVCAASCPADSAGWAVED